MASRYNPIQIFAGSGSHKLAERIAANYGRPLGRVTINRFSDGEMQPSINESIRGSDVFIVQSIFAPADNFMELLLLIDATVRASANTVTAVIPYYGYARQDRKDKPRVSIGAKMIANLLKAAGANRILTMDLHAPQIQGFFSIPSDNLEANILFTPYVKKLNLPNPVVASPDAGGAKRARVFANQLGCDFVLCDKDRQIANKVADMIVIGDVTGKDVILIDDLIDTAGTLCKAAGILLEHGANSVRACITHPVLSGPAYDRIAASDLEELVVCDTIPLKQEISKIKSISVAPLFAQAIRIICENGSISSLFRIAEE